MRRRWRDQKFLSTVVDVGSTRKRYNPNSGRNSGTPGSKNTISRVGARLLLSWQDSHHLPQSTICNLMTDGSAREALAAKSNSLRCECFRLPVQFLWRCEADGRAVPPRFVRLKSRSFHFDLIVDSLPKLSGFGIQQVGYHLSDILLASDE